MIVFDVLVVLLIIYLFVYCIYQLVFYIKARGVEEYFEIQEKIRSLSVNKNKFCVLIYASRKDKNLDDLLNDLYCQTYDKNFYDVYVAYQRDETDTTPCRDFVKGAKIYNIQNPDFFSKDKAINLLLRKMQEEEKYSAYIFLDADCSVEKDYLENINKTVTTSGVYVGNKICTNKKNQFAKIVKNLILTSYIKYTNRTSKIARSMFDLLSYVDGDNLIVTSDVVKQLGYIGLEDKASQLECSLELASKGIKTYFSPYITVSVDIKNYDFSSASLSDKISLYMHYFPILLLKEPCFKEFILFLLKPNSLFVILSFALIIEISIYFTNHVAVGAVCALGAFLLVNFILSITISKLTFYEILCLILYPFCLSWQKIKGVIKSLTMRSIIRSYEEENVNSATFEAVVNNGKKDISCKIDLVVEDGMKKVIFREGNKFITTNPYLRMYDALNDMTYKLQSKGLVLKICQNCQNFTSCPDGTLDCCRGKCNISQSDILIWNGCQYFYPVKKS